MPMGWRTLKKLIGLAEVEAEIESLAGTYTGSLQVDGSVSGGIKVSPIATGTALTTIQNQNVAAATITLPLATAELATLGLAETLTLKTLTAAGAIAQTGGVAFTTGTGAVSLNGDVTIAAGKGLILTKDTLRVGGFNTGGASTDAVILEAALDLWTDGQLDVVSAFGASIAALSANYSSKVGRFRHLVVTSSATILQETYGLVGQLVVKSSTLTHLHAGLMGTLECQTALTAPASSGSPHAARGAAAVIGRTGGSTFTVAATGKLYGFLALGTASTVTITSGGIYAAYGVDIASTGQAWGIGLSIEPTSCVKCIKVGSEAFTASGSGLPLDGVTLHSGAEFYFDDGGVKLAAGYTEAFRCGFLVSTAITTADVSLYTAHDYVYLAANVSTAGGVGASWASLLVKTGVTITTASGLCDFSAFNASCDVPSGATIAASTWVAGISMGGNLGGTHTGKAVAFRVRTPSAGAWDGLFDIPAALSADGDGGGAAKYILCYIGGVAAKITAKLVS